jgi:diaminopimelate decarboxylase
MPDTFTEQLDLEALAGQVGTPFFLYSADVLRRRIAAVKKIIPGDTLQARYAMKACSTRRVLEEIRDAGIWIDAVSGNEVLRARNAGFPPGNTPPAILFTADVFRDNALEVITGTEVLPNIGSPAMIDDLIGARYRGPIGVRINPGFGHGHVRECDTGGPSSKHGIWHEAADRVRDAATDAGMPIVLLHTHIGSGPQIEEFNRNMARLVEFFAERIPSYPDLQAVNLGGGIPHPYRPGAPDVDLAPLGEILRMAQATLSARARRPIRVEIEPGRYVIAPSAVLVTRVSDVKTTAANDKGPGHRFAMVDAGFTDLVRPAMYGSYHHITRHGGGTTSGTEAVVVAGPLCESGDVFTRDAREFLEPRELPKLRRGDLLVLHDAGAYGVQMSSYYNSLGRAPQVWLDGGRFHLISRRETLSDIIGNECDEPLPA